MDTSHKVPSYAVMNPVLWGRLPRELLVLVLAHLPVPTLSRLRCQLSKEWTLNMEFIRACDEANPNMVALLLYTGQANEFFVRIFDFSNCVWLYEYRFRLTHRRKTASGSLELWKPMASDGGLVCFVSIWKYKKANPLCIVVMNPLTRVQLELPPLQHVYTVPPTLVHMKLDSETKGYKVVVVGDNGGRHTVETYDSVSREWSRAAPSWGRILGCACEWKIWRRNCFFLESSSLCAYDLEERQLKLFDPHLLFQSEGAYVVHYALAGDRMFVLQKKSNQRSGFYFITEFQFENTGDVWVPVRTHGQCFPEEEAWSFDLHACKDLLMLLNPFYSTNRSCCVRNFFPSEWLPENLAQVRYVSLMCRVFWHVTP